MWIFALVNSYFRCKYAVCACKNPGRSVVNLSFSVTWALGGCSVGFFLLWLMGRFVVVLRLGPDLSLAYSDGFIYLSGCFVGSFRGFLGFPRHLEDALTFVSNIGRDSLSCWHSGFGGANLVFWLSVGGDLSYISVLRFSFHRSSLRYIPHASSAFVRVWCVFRVLLRRDIADVLRAAVLYSSFLFGMWAIV